MTNVRTPKQPVILIRLTEAEKKAVERAARKAGKTFAAQWARDVLLAAAMPA